MTAVSTVTATGAASLLIAAKVAAVAMVAIAAFGAGKRFDHSAVAVQAPSAAEATPISLKIDPRIATLEDQIRRANERATMAEQDNTRLLDAIQKFKEGSLRNQGATAVAALPVVVGPEEYMLKAGDTRQRIANSMGVSVQELLDLNPGVNWARLHVGDMIHLPARNVSH
jgi:hypothetical protein